MPSGKQFLVGALITVATLWILHATKLSDKVLPPM